MPVLYRYVGPRHLLPPAETDRTAVTSPGDVGGLMGTARSVTFTFLVDEAGQMWLADRHSEHVACGRGRPVRSAGEITFTLGRDGLEVTDVSNQSTGYCPEPESWSAVADALARAGIPPPDSFSRVCVFRRCPGCASINLVKDGVFECGVCGGELPRGWNCDS